jgi:hypothetical protein
MKTNDLDVLRRVDPAAGIPDGPQAELLLARLDRVRTRITAEQQVGPVHPAVVATDRSRPVPRRTVLLGAAAGAVAAGAGLVAVDPFGSTGVAVAATPPVLDSELAPGRPAKGALLELAARAGRDRSVRGHAGDVHVVRTQSWDLATDVDGKRVTSAVVPLERELRWSSDLTGHMVVKAGRPWIPADPAYRKEWAREGNPKTPEGSVVDEMTWSRGSYQTAFHYPLPSDPQQLLAELKVGNDFDLNGTSQLIGSVADIYQETMPAPAVRSAVLTVLAGRSDVVALGAIKDRAGRTGLAFATDSASSGLPTRYVVIFDPATGALLTAEEVLTKNAGELNVRIPSVISYTLFL